MINQFGGAWTVPSPIEIMAYIEMHLGVDCLDKDFQQKVVSLCSLVIAQ